MAFSHTKHWQHWWISTHGSSAQFVAPKPAELWPTTLGLTEDTHVRQLPWLCRAISCRCRPQMMADASPHRKMSLARCEHGDVLQWSNASTCWPGAGAAPTVQILPYSPAGQSHRTSRQDWAKTPRALVLARQQLFSASNICRGCQRCSTASPGMPISDLTTG